MLIIHHNFIPSRFKWLWAKYVHDGDDTRHCTACIKGKYSKKFSATSNKDLLTQTTLVMDEEPTGTFDAIYFCGVVKKGYLNKDPKKNNYPHNVHFAVLPCEGAHDVWDFEEWHVEIENGRLSRIPTEEELDDRYFHAPNDAHYYTCRIFRWMVGRYYPKSIKRKKNYE